MKYKAYLIGVTPNGTEYKINSPCVESLEDAENRARQLAKMAIRVGDTIRDYGWTPVES